MARTVRAAAAVLLVIVGLGVTGCIHTLTQTYQDYPPSISSHPQHPQDNPGDG